MGLRQILNSGNDWGPVGKHLSDCYISNPAEMTRRAAAVKRDDLYNRKGDSYIEQLIDTAFKDKLTQSLRKDLVAWAKWNNFIGRVVNEKATVYSAPARRKVKQQDEQFQKFCELVSIDNVLREFNRLLVLHEDVWVQYRVRLTPRLVRDKDGNPQKDADGADIVEREPTLDVVSPARFWAISHPKDNTLLVGIILDQRNGELQSTEPAYRVWTDDETFLLDGDCKVISSSVQPWPLGRMPGVLVSLRPTGTKQGLLAECPNADLVAAHEAIWFQNVLLLKESKSANRQTYATGDTSHVVTGQSADTEKENILPDGVTIQSVDRGMDLAQFRDNAKDIADTAGANHGVPPSVREQRDATSGAEVYLRRIPLAELRLEQIPVCRAFEGRVFVVIAMVNRQDFPEYAFDAEGFGVDYGEIRQPLTEAERDQVFEKRRQLLLTNTLDELQRRNPDLQTEAQAQEELARNIGIEIVRVHYMQELQKLNGGTSSQPGDPTPQQNGAAGNAASTAAAPNPDEDEPA